MTQTRSLRSTYIFAFVLGGLFGLLLAKPARAAEQPVVERHVESADIAAR